MTIAVSNEFVAAPEAAAETRATEAVRVKAVALPESSPTGMAPKSAKRFSDKVHAQPRMKVGAGAVLQTGAALLWLPQAGLLAYALGLVMKGGALTQVAWIAIAVLMLGIIRAALDAAGSRIAFKAARATLAVLRERAVCALMRRSPLDNSRPASGLAASVIAEQAEAVIPYLSRFQPVRQRVSVVPLVILAVVLWFSWVAALILLVAAPLIPVFMALIGWRAKAASEAQLAELGGMNGFLLDRLRGLSTIRAFDAVDLTAHRLRNNAESLRRRTMVVLRIAFLSSAVLELFSALGVAMVAVYTGFHLLGQLDFGAWGGKLTLPESFFILLLAPAFFEPLRDLSAVWHDRASGEAAIKALEVLGGEGAAMVSDAAQFCPSPLPSPRKERGEGGVNVASSSFFPCTRQKNETETSVSPSPRARGEGKGEGQPARVSEGQAALHLTNLRFRHAGSDTPLFDNFNLTVSPGEHVALWGPSGCGKSTLLALMGGLVIPEEGNITLCGPPFLPETAADIRARMAWVGQKPHIFAGSAEANITLGRDGGEAEIEAALEAANLTDVIRNRAALGESGIGLSGGEALRLSLARAAFNTEAAIILADEPTAHLDHQTALKVMDSLLALAKGKTLVVATHDPALALRMDRLVRLDAGRRA